MGKTQWGALPLEKNQEITLVLSHTSCPEYPNQRSQPWFPSPVATLTPDNWTEIENLEPDLRLLESETQMERERLREAL